MIFFKKKMKIAYLIINTKTDYSDWILIEFLLKINKQYIYKHLSKFILKQSKRQNMHKRDKRLLQRFIDDSALINELIALFIQFTSNSKIKTIVVYTNDLRFLTLKLINMQGSLKSVKFDYFIFNSKFYYIKIYIKDSIIIIKNIFLFFPDLKNEIAETLNQNSQLNNYENLTNNSYKWKKNSMQEFLETCEQSINKLNKIIQNYFKIWHKNKFSISSISKKIFIKKFNTFDIKLRCPLKTDTILRNAYFTGRDEVFGNSYSNDKILYFDYPNMHGSIMLEDFYYDDLSEYDNPTNHETPGIYKINAFSDSSNMYPLLPNRLSFTGDNSNSTVFYANGYITGWYTHEMCAYFLSLNSNNRIIKYEKAFIFNSSKKKPIFKKFAEHFINLKVSNQNEERKLFKMILNSLPGILGLKPSDVSFIILSKKEYKNWLKKNKEFLISEEKIIYNNDNETYLIEYSAVANKLKLQDTRNKLNNIEGVIKDDSRNLNKSFNVSQLNNQEEFVNSNLIYSIFINSRAAIKLHKTIHLLTNLGTRVLAVKTDALWVAVSEKLHETIINKNINGVYFDTSKEETEIKSIIFINPSSYAVNYQKSNKKEVYLYNKKINWLDYNDYENILKQDFNQKTIKLKNNIIANAYKKRLWHPFNKLTSPLFIYDNQLLTIFDI